MTTPDCPATSTCTFWSAAMRAMTTVVGVTTRTGVARRADGYPTRTKRGDGTASWHSGLVASPSVNVSPSQPAVGQRCGAVPTRATHWNPYILIVGECLLVR
ncbi:MAG: hypothetical protein OXE04_04150 [bacterium]|nr:hypothetical protein [bacterium]